MLLHRSKKDPAFALLKQKTVRLKIEGELRVVQTLFRGSKKSSAFASLKQKTVQMKIKEDSLETHQSTILHRIPRRRLAGDFIAKKLCY
jgi:hypothetical protein